MSRQVGFTFQGDVFLGSSLAVSATGRLLKLFSDAGVDTYAVAAVLQLGKQLPISQHREMVVSTAMLKRGNSRAGFLAKALRIGWGCNDTAYELSRTREGSAALMLADAFAAGRTYYLAAQALQELLSVSGCDREYLPSVTALKGLVSHVAPIMEDSGFHAILEHIRVTTTIALRRLPPSSDVEHDLIGILNDDGLPRDWAGIVKQLMLVASREETAYLQTNTRGAWFAAFAVHILSMECALLHHSNVLWHAAGSQGAVTIQLAIDSAPPPRQRFWCSLVLEVNPHSDNLRSQKPQTLETFYILRDALQIELSAFPGMSVYFQNVIQSKIVRILVRLVQEVQIGKYWSPYQGSMINNEAFRHPSVVRSVLRDLGINLDISILGRPSDEDVNEGIVIPPALLEACPCKVHRGCGSGDKIKCFQIFFDRLVWGIAATAMALLIL